jgi:3-deoxy-D-manno-octulosonate 8-phosphate phosphatase (KDO 8-P phosphatase)
MQPTSDERSVVRLVISDFDGVHTDNRVFVFDDGREAVVCNRADGQACSMMAALGVEVVILSTETNPVVTARASKLGIDAEVAVADKGAAVRRLLAVRGLSRRDAVYVGNDANDLVAAVEVEWVVAPADAHPDFLAVATHVTAARGGEGVLRELVTVTAQGEVPWRF